MHGGGAFIGFLLSSTPYPTLFVEMTGPFTLRHQLLKQPAKRLNSIGLA